MRTPTYRYDPRRQGFGREALSEGSSKLPEICTGSDLFRPSFEDTEEPSGEGGSGLEHRAEGRFAACRPDLVGVQLRINGNPPLDLPATLTVSCFNPPAVGDVHLCPLNLDGGLCAAELADRSHLTGDDVGEDRLQVSFPLGEHGLRRRATVAHQGDKREKRDDLAQETMPVPSGVRCRHMRSVGGMSGARSQFPPTVLRKLTQLQLGIY